MPAHPEPIIATFLPDSFISPICALVASPTYLSSAPIAIGSDLIPNTHLPSH